VLTLCVRGGSISYVLMTVPIVSWPPVYHEPQLGHRNLVTQVSGASGAGALRLEDQLTEFLAWLLSRSSELTRAVVEQFFRGDDHALAELHKSDRFGIETQVRLPPIGPGNHLRPDLSITGPDRRFQLLVEIKAEADFHHVEAEDGSQIDQASAYVCAWELLEGQHEARLRRVGTLTRDGTAPEHGRPRAADVSWTEIARTIEQSERRGHLDALSLKAVATDLCEAIDLLFGTLVEPAGFLVGAGELVAAVAAAMARACGGTASPVTVKHNSLYAGSYITFPDAEGSQSRIWVYCTPTGGWYNPVGHPPALWISETDTPWSELVEAGFRSLDFGRIRDRRGYKLLRLARPLDATAVVGRDPRERENACAWATDLMHAAGPTRA
jgi:hypothetical protein